MRCSSSERTLETLKRIGLPDEVEVRIEPDLYAASAGELVAFVKAKELA